MTSLSEIRTTFLDFFARTGHAVVPYGRGKLRIRPA